MAGVTHKLRYPWMDEDPERLPMGAIFVERVALDNKGELVLQGRVVAADGRRSKVRPNMVPRPDQIANLFIARALRTRRGMFFPHDLENPWKEALDAISEADHG